MLQVAVGAYSVSSSTPRHRPDLFKAIRNRDHKEISSLMKSGATWWFADDSNQTVLHMAVKKRCDEPQEQHRVIKLLYQFLQSKKLKVDVKCDAGRTALHLAARNGMLRVVDFLIKQGAKLNVRDARGNGIAHYMVEGEFEKYFELSRKATSSDKFQPMYQESVYFFNAMLSKNIEIDYANKNLDSPLHVAVRRNLLHILPIMLDYTQDVTLCDKQQQNVLHLFIESKNAGTFKVMSSSCYDKSLIMDIFQMMLTKGFSVSAVDVLGNTPLHSAVYQDKTPFIKLMMKKFKETENNDGNTILNFIIDNCINSTSNKHREDSVEFVCILLSNGANIDKPNKEGYKPLQLAVMRVNPIIIHVLKDYGADFKEPYNEGNLLHLLSENSSKVISSRKVEDVIDFLVNEGCDVNARDENGMAPLHLAVKSGRNSVVEGLINYHADVDARESSGRKFTPLQIAVEGNNDKLINTLVKFGADVNAKNSAGETALHLAMKFKAGMVKTLLESGAHIDVEDDKEFIPLHHAIKRQNSSALAELLKYGADINDIDTYRELICLKDPGLMLFSVLEHWIKMQAAGMPIAKSYERLTADDTYQKLFQDCLKEVETLKAYKIGDSTSLYGLLHMDRNFRCAYVTNKPFKDLIESTTLETKFPKYYVLVLASYHEAVARKPLLEPAKEAWCEFTDIILPDVCVYRILAHLNNRYLRVMVEGLKDISFRK